MALTANDARDIADGLLESANAIDKFLDDNFANISRAQYESMSESARTLLRLCGFITTQAVGLTIAQMDNDAAELKSVIADAKQSLEDLQEIRTAIRLAAALADLATAILAKDPGGAFKAVKSVYEVTTQGVADA